MNNFCPKRGIVPQLKVEVNPINMRMFLNEINAGQEGFPDPVKDLFLFRFLFDLDQGPFDQSDGIIEHIEKKALFVIEILKDGALGNSKTPDHSVDRGPLIALFGKLMDSRFYNPALFFFREIEKGGLDLDGGGRRFHGKQL